MPTRIGRQRYKGKPNKPAGDLTPAQANYRRGYPLRQCGVCVNYWHRDTGKLFGGCTKVTGKNISPYGICDLFSQLNNPWGNKMPAPARQQMEQFYDASRGDGPTPADHG